MSEPANGLPSYTANLLEVIKHYGRPATQTQLRIKMNRIYPHHADKPEKISATLCHLINSGLVVKVPIRNPKSGTASCRYRYKTTSLYRPIVTEVK